MPYDPTHPINGEIADADEIRAQFSSFTKAPRIPALRKAAISPMLRA